jgi:hypothetical protein
MRSRLRAILILLLALAPLAPVASIAPVASAQGVARQQLVVPLAGFGFVGFRLETVLEGARGATQGGAQNFAEIQAALLPQALLDVGNTIHRVVLDREGNPVFGYDLVVEPLGDARKFRVTARPLGADFERQLRVRRASAATPAAPVPTLARATDAQTLDDGDALALDLLVNPQTGVRVVDVIKVATDRARLWQAAPRDFTLDSVQLALRSPRLVVNGEALAGARASRTVSGALVWFYVPGRGRFILSLVPRAGYAFEKIALIEDERVSFDFRGVHYEWTSSAPVVGDGGSWFAWVLHDPRYTPEVSSAEEITQDIERRDGDDNDGGTLKQILSGRTPQPTPRAGLDAKNSTGDAKHAASAPRVRFGAADRIENLLPKN